MFYVFFYFIALVFLVYLHGLNTILLLHFSIWAILSLLIKTAFVYILISILWVIGISCWVRIWTGMPDVDFNLTLVLDLLILVVLQSLLNAGESSEFWEDLVFYWQIDDLLFFVHLFYEIHKLFHFLSWSFTLFKSLYGFEVSHFINKRVFWFLWQYLDLTCKGLLIERISIRELDCGWFYELLFEGDVEMSDLSFENVGYWFGIGNDAFD